MPIYITTVTYKHPIFKPVVLEYNEEETLIGLMQLVTDQTGVAATVKHVGFKLETRKIEAETV